MNYTFPNRTSRFETDFDIKDSKVGVSRETGGACPFEAPDSTSGVRGVQAFVLFVFFYLLVCFKFVMSFGLCTFYHIHG